MSTTVAAAAAAAAPAAPVTESVVDVTQRIVPYLDPHLAITLLEFVAQTGVYREDAVDAALLSVVLKTTRFDYAAYLYRKLNPSATELPAEYAEREKAAADALLAAQRRAGPLLKLFEQPELLKQLRADKLFHFLYLRDKFGVDGGHVDALYEVAKLHFDAGNYGVAQDLLFHYRILSGQGERAVQTMWGRLACNILERHWDLAMDDVLRMREYLDGRQFNESTKDQLQQRLWLMHWALFVFFNHHNGRNAIIDIFMQDRAMNVIQAAAPHLLRYVTVAVIVNRRRRNVLRKLVDIVQQEKYMYSDALTEFVESLYVHFDFDVAHSKLQACEELLRKDMFLSELADEFIEAGRLFIFETYCRIHRSIDISMLSKRLHMNDASQAERWIVEMIRQSRLDAKVDTTAQRVLVSAQTPSVHQQVLERSNGLLFRARILASACATLNKTPEPSR